MLDLYEKEQTKVIKILKNSITKNKVSHAYLFEANDYIDAKKVALAFAKSLLCPYNYTNNQKCVNCTQCINIEKNIFPEIKIIEPDGLWIKKEQLDLLQKEFNEKSILSTKKIYIINQADRLNKAAANSILKFLEEPEDNIIAILITNNMYQLLNTIISRCQIISFSKIDKFDNKNLVDKIKSNIQIINNNELIEEDLENKIGQVLDFINYFEKNKINTLLKTQKLWHNNFKEKEEILFGFNLMLLIYQDVLNIKLNRTIKIFNKYEEQIEKIALLNTIDSLTNKINVIMKEKNKINININSNLLIDKLIIELERCD